MIRNDRQYRISKSQAEEFERSLADLMTSPPKGVAPAIHKAQLDALRSQLDELRSELSEYEALRDGKQHVLELSSLDELPQALIRARIAAGMTQRELAERLSIKEQQIQRYEATNYMSASLTRIKEVVAALGVKVREEVFLRTVDTSFNAIAKRLERVGLDREFIEKRLLPVDAIGVLDASDTEQTEGIGLRLAPIVNRVFGWAPAALFTGERALTAVPAMGMRFKMPANAEGKRTAVQAAYARYLAGLVIQATQRTEQKPVPTGARQVRDEILRMHGDLNLRACLEYAWQLGIPVLPLRETGGFHGATWRFAGRNVIVLKQTTRSSARWMHDFFHELRHAAEDPASQELEAIDSELMAKIRRDLPEEQNATAFAGDILLDGRAEDLAEKAVNEARGRLEKLKSAVPKVASREGVQPDVLANYMAYRLALQGENWWGAAMNLQRINEEPWRIARDFLVERLELRSLDEVDYHLLSRALESE